MTESRLKIGLVNMSREWTTENDDERSPAEIERDKQRERQDQEK